MTVLKKYKQLFLLINLLFLSTFSTAGWASDIAKEKRWAEQVTDSLLTGDAVWLEDGKAKFLGIYTESSLAKTTGGIIVVHGIGVHPNWPDVVQPIRTELPEYGWATLSIQMPILENGKTATDYIPLFKEVSSRFAAAVLFLKAKNIKNIIIISHSLGTAMTNHYLISQPNPIIRAYVAISASTDPKVNELNTVKSIGQIKKIPMLDIYGSQDLDSVLHYSKQRLIAGQKTNPRYKQVMIKGADHFYQSKHIPLIKTIRLWLQKNAPSIEVPIKK